MGAGEWGSGAFAPEWGRVGARGIGARGRVVDFVTGLFIGLNTCVLPFVYLYFAFGAVFPSDLEVTHILFIVANVGANLLCTLIALLHNGRLAHRLNWALLNVLVVHAALMLCVLSLRAYYSRPIMLLAIFSSLVMVNCVVLLSDRMRRKRVGIIPQFVPKDLLDWIGRRADIIPSDSISPKSYGLILVDLSRVLDQRWSIYVSNAMLSGVEVRHLAEYVEELRGRASPDHFHVDHIARNPASRIYPHVKYAFDVLLVLLILPTALIAGMLAVIAIVLSMGRPVLFTQDRVGLGGKTFRMYKFRTMRKGSSLEAEESATAVGDERVTPLGRWLRRLRIDALPQLWNVLRGEMSIVGPRPEQPKLCMHYETLMSTFPCRHLVRPGITGWAQVRFGYAGNEHETRNKLSYDLYYTKYMSPFLDVQILFETVITIIHGKSVR